MKAFSGKSHVKLCMFFSPADILLFSITADNGSLSPPLYDQLFQKIVLKFGLQCNSEAVFAM